jgi:hypothetical protein
VCCFIHILQTHLILFSFFFLFYRTEIRDIRRQLKRNNGANKQRVDRSITTINNSNKNRVRRFNSNNKKPINFFQI